ncbi:acyl carrier protein [Buchnera aphidicola (Aphis craccivora)]|uniref:Acyl carrier protein n=1 Tax=Buchnera aphidicola (Aphis craccivora) TaxID=466616 RepID=A0A4D6XN97_9GAMM|nr:acyl carrier protein [Buchnera aphidicola]QCI16594.1 acyl carrier protein [Buchnera aphidicola (Aphis craccivora)]QLL40728.1 acyl carrier protein [Buchnera aphidicola (Aphis craccivore)]WAI17567.1 MAG: acyl carrier protein [Buchnera aphidicola (Aphis craccivora)]
MKDIENKIKKIISKKLDIKIEHITNNSSFLEDLGADSLDIVELIMTLEEDFNIEISDNEAEKIKTVQSAINFINSKIKN